MGIGDAGRLLLIGGLVIAGAGAGLLLLARLRVTQLPGTISVGSASFSLVIPLAVCIILSVVLTVVLNIVLRLWR